jgi:hypothetical protein
MKLPSRSFKGVPNIEHNVILNERERTKNPRVLILVGATSWETLRSAQGDTVSYILEFKHSLHVNREYRYRKSVSHRERFACDVLKFQI